MGDPGPKGSNGDPGETLYTVIQLVKQNIAGLDGHIW